MTTPDPINPPGGGPLCPYCGGGPVVAVPTLGLVCKSCARIVIARVRRT